jgi:hypothetical protein
MSGTRSRLCLHDSPDHRINANLDPSLDLQSPGKRKSSDCCPKVMAGVSFRTFDT